MNHDAKRHPIFSQLEQKTHETPDGAVRYWVNTRPDANPRNANGPDIVAHEGPNVAIQSRHPETTARSKVPEPDTCGGISANKPSGTDAFGEISTNSANTPHQPCLVFLPGLTADARLFERQLEYFANRMPCLVWDPPSHGMSRPFALTWSMDDLARTLHAILAAEGITHPVLIGQSMGGYVAQAYMDLFPGEVRGFVSIDSAPLKRSYYQGWELWSLRHMRGVYSCMPWSLLRNWAAKGCATSTYGQNLMRSFIDGYEKSEYCDLAGHGYRALSEAAAANRPYEIDCPALLFVGTKDAAGSVKSYTKKWVARENLPLIWLEGAGHNSTCDAPAEVNAAIEKFVRELEH